MKFKVELNGKNYIVEAERAAMDMTKKDIVLLDLDGTISHSSPGIVSSIEYALKKAGITPPPRAELESHVGPPLKRVFMESYGFDEPRALECINFYREYFSERGIFENFMYEGIEALLSRLCSLGKTVALATSKPTVYAERICEYFKISCYFRFVAGSELDNTRTDKREVIEYALANLGNPDKSRVVMVGDRKHDIIGARQAGVDCVGVLFGYGSRDELESERPARIAASVSELQSILCGE